MIMMWIKVAGAYLAFGTIYINGVLFYYDQKLGRENLRLMLLMIISWPIFLLIFTLYLAFAYFIRAKQWIGARIYKLKTAISSFKLRNKRRQ